VQVELDHLFICTAAGAPEAEKRIRFGLSEGTPNDHPGQGTANRRFAFSNAMIELLWVYEPEKAQNQVSTRTMLWDRWVGPCDRRHWFREHAAGIHEITRLTLHTPVPLSSRAAQTLVEAEVIEVASSTAYGLEVEFDRKRTGKRVDFRPDLPLVFQL
jgi:hypothetical protein